MKYASIKLIMALAAIIMIGSGCPLFSQTDNNLAGKRLSVVYQAFDLVSVLTSVQANDIVLDFSREDKISVTRAINVSVNLDETDNEGQDKYPQASGTLQITGNVTLGGTPLSGATISAPSLVVTASSDIVVTDAESGYVAVIPGGTVINSAANGTYTLSLQNGYTSNLTAATTVNDLLITITSPAKAIASVTVDADMNLATTYTDNNILEDPEGTRVYTADSTVTLAYAQGFLSIIAELDVLITNTVQDITLTVNDKEIGSYTLTEWLDTFGAMINTAWDN